MDVRGSGPVQQKAVVEVKSRVQDLLAQLDGENPPAALVA